MSQYVVNRRSGEPYDIYVGRPSPFGNPFKIGRDGDRDEVIEQYRAWLLAQPALVARVRQELRGKVLGCWCKPKDGFKGRLLCHAQVLAEIANAPEPDPGEEV